MIHCPKCSKAAIVESYVVVCFWCGARTPLHSGRSYEDRIDLDSTIDTHDNSDGSMRYGLGKTMRDE